MQRPESRRRADGELDRAMDRFAELVDRVTRRGLRALKDDELLEFGRFYRMALSELSYAQRHGLDPERTAYLNALAGRAYGYIYVTRSSSWAGVVSFFREGLPRTFRRNIRFFAASAALFLGTALLAALATALDRRLVEAAFPVFGEMAREIAGRHRGGPDWLPAEVRPLVSSLVMTNNLQVSFLAFAGGVFAGAGTVYVLVANGLILGAIGTEVFRAGVAYPFWGFVLPHGVLELPAVMICGAAGLMLGWSLISPGLYTRATALRLAGREAVKLLMGAAALLVPAGIIEGLFSPSRVPEPIKYAAAAVIFAGLVWYLSLGAARPATAAPSASVQGSGSAQ